MLKTRLPRVILLCLAFGLVASSCSRESDELGGALRDEDGLLRYVPADTPYLVVTPGDIPDDVADKLEPQLDTALKAYGSILRSVVGNARLVEGAEGEAGAAGQALEPFVDGLVELMSVEGLRSAGIDRNTDLALYGVGLLPVMRLSVSGGELMEATIANLESRAGETMSVGTIGSTEYRYVGDEEGRFIIGILDDQLVISLVPGKHLPA